MPRSKDISYKAGGYGRQAYLAVKRDGRYIFTGCEPKMTCEEIALAIQDLEDGLSDVEQAWGWTWNELPHRLFDIMRTEPESAFARIGITRGDLGKMASLCFYPDSYQTLRMAWEILPIIEKIVTDAEVVHKLDERFWSADTAVFDGEILIPVPPLREDKFSLWMIRDIVNDERRFSKRKQRW